MRRAFKYRLRPNVNQARELSQSLNTHRILYNNALAQRKEAWEQEQRSVTFQQQYRHFANLRNAQVEARKRGEPGPHWLARISATSMRDTLDRLDKAFQAFFRRIREGEKPGYPRFRGRDRYDSIPWDNYANGCRLIDQSSTTVPGNMADDAELRGHRLHVFGVGDVRVRLHRPIRGKIKTVTVKREADHWYVVFSCDLGPVPVEPSTMPPIGIDVGLEHFLTTSEGEHEPNPRHLKKHLSEMKRLSRKIALRDGKKQKRRQYPQRGSKSRQKCKKRLARLHRKVRNVRREHHHQIALKLVRRYGLVAVERLNIRGMLKNHRLARAISDAGWSGFLLTLKCKAEGAGTLVVEVDPRGTSQECSGCGAEVKKDLKVRRHDCPHCGLSLQRDHNAALNILARAQARAEPAGHNGGSSPRVPRKPVRPRKPSCPPVPREEPLLKTPARVPKKGRLRKPSQGASLT